MTLQQFLDMLGSAAIWTSPNPTWQEIDQYSKQSHLLIPIPLAVLLLILKNLLSTFWFGPVGFSFGIKNVRTKKAHPNPILEKAYLAEKRIKHKQIVGLAKQCDRSERQVERWLRLRKSQDKLAVLCKFNESCWRWLYYACSFSYGINCLWDKPWLWSLKECYNGYPYQRITSDCWWYYIYSMSYYWALIFNELFDVKRKDFWQMLLHHVATICLLNISWLCNLHRLGTIVLLVHDCADVFLEAAKLAKYAQYQKVCDTFFIIFTLIWLLTRCCFYPFWIIYSTVLEAPTIAPMYSAYYILNFLLILLMGLHLFWAKAILQIFVTAVSAGQINGDINSASSDHLTGESD